MLFNLAKKALRLNGYCRSLQDEFQEVSVLFIKVIDRYFDPNRGVALTTYFYTLFGKGFRSSRGGERTIKLPTKHNPKYRDNTKVSLMGEFNWDSKYNVDYASIASNNELSSMVWSVAETILDDKDYKIFYEHFVNGKNQTTLSIEYGCTRENIRRKLEISMTKIRNYFIENDIFLSAFDEEI